eukprot:TRINITY_DN1027_c0_g2_i1.p1 TRINITY_DN1027_c0_g2~~TRINITY_DN1027_c0_g2_i1.p1  ORF type:complete len:498 (+),score=42.28 TRINITY_DN1027_c0_g2_i1:2-1495(+)
MHISEISEKPGAPLDEALIANQEMVSFDRILTKVIGWGPYQSKSYLALGLYNFADGCQTLVVSLTLRKLFEEWNNASEDAYVSWILSFHFIAGICGAMLSGLVADRFGRRRPIIWGMLVAALLCVCSGVFMDLFTHVICRSLINGIFCFLTPISSTYLAELTPIFRRSYIMILIGVCYCIGELYACLITFLCVHFAPAHYSISITFLFGSLPCWAAYGYCVYALKESARYELVAGRYDTGMKLTMEMYETNTGKDGRKITESRYTMKLLEWARDLNKRQIQGRTWSILALFNTVNRPITMFLWVIWLIYGVVNTSILTILPIMALEDEPDLDPALWKIAIASLCELPAPLIAMVLGESSLGRQKSIIITCVSNMIGFVALQFNPQGILFAVCSGFTRLGLATFFLLSFQYTTEVYVTKYRATGLGMATSFEQIGGVIVPWVSALSYGYAEERVVFIIYITLFFIGGLATWFLPYDTRGKDLDNSSKTSNNHGGGRNP